jgi:hypothetical protein
MKGALDRENRSPSREGGASGLGGGNRIIGWQIPANAHANKIIPYCYDGSVRGEIASSPREDNARATRRNFGSAVGYTLRCRFTKAGMAS